MSKVRHGWANPTPNATGSNYHYFPIRQGPSLCLGWNARIKETFNPERPDDAVGNCEECQAKRGMQKFREERAA